MLREVDTQSLYEKILSDQGTPVSMDDLQEAFFRNAPAWVKIHMMNDLNKMALDLIQSGIALRFPGIGAASINRLSADLIYGSEVAEKVFGRVQ